MRHQGPGYHNLCVLSCLAPVVNINIKTGINTKQQGTKEVLTPQRLYIKSLSSLSLPKWSSMRGLCPKQSSGSGLAQSLWPLFLNFWNEIAQLKKKQNTRCGSVFCFVFCYFYSRKIFKKNKCTKQSSTPECLPFKLFLLLRRNMNSCCTGARLIWSSTQGSVPRGNWNVTPYPFTLQKCSEKQNLVLLLPFSPLSDSSLTSLPPSLRPSVFLLLLRRVCVCIFHYISVIISHPAGRNPLPKTILLRSTLRTIPACNSVWLSLAGILSKLMHVGNKMDYQMWSKMLIWAWNWAIIVKAKSS